MLDNILPSAGHRRDLETATAAFEKNLYDAADFLESRGISEAAALGFRLGRVGSNPPQGFERFTNMLSIPYLSRGGVLALKFRALDPERKPKYDAPEGQTARLYNVEALHSTGDTVAICEGELDALVMSTVVGIPAVGIPGASQWQPWWSRCFVDYERVLVISDHDAKEDGSDPGLKHAKKVVSKVAGGRLVLPPAGMDLGEWVLKSGGAAVREACGV